MLTKEQKASLRNDLFRHLDGFVTVPTAYALLERGVLAYLIEKGEASLSQLTEEFEANEGYLNIALRVLSSQGWLDHHINNEADVIRYATNANSATAFALCPLFEDLVALLKFSEKFHPTQFQEGLFQRLAAVYDKYRNHFGIEFAHDPGEAAIQRQVLKHIEGVLVGPPIVGLGMGGMFHKYFMLASFRPEEFHQKADSFAILLDFFADLGWFTKKNNTYQFTDEGLFFARRASAYGVTVSYGNTFRHLDELIFGNPAVLRAVEPGKPEIHVDRTMNVWGSGGTHGSYFKKVDDIIIDLFNQPIEQQPKGIVDMGCGNGAYLKHLYEVVESRTKRGEMLEDYPLFLVGVDYNEEALLATRATLIQANIWAKLIWGDIGRPDLLARDLLDDYNIELKDLLNVRTFLDHNRIWTSPTERTAGRISDSTGAFAHRGQRISNNEVEDNLLEHFKLWAPYVQKFGLLVIELHTLPPELVAQHLGQTAATAYDATHGFSDQYIVELPIFNRIAREAGLFPDERYQAKFPNSDLATVSINLLKGRST